MLIDSTVEIKWVTINKDWYIDKGYIFTKVGDRFIVEIKDVMQNSKVKLNLKCDYCDDAFTRMFSVWKRSKDESPIQKDACPKCIGVKRKEANLVLHGVENVMQIEEVKERQFKTNLEKYGVPHALQNEEVKDKLKTTNNIRYGGNAPAFCEKVVKKMKQTNMEKYGNVCYLQSEEGRKRIDKINIEKYGTAFPLQSPEIRHKALLSLYKNGSAPTSTQQKHIHSLVKGELNYLVSRSFLDIAFLQDKIYLEYDGGGHNLTVKMGKMSQEEFDKKEQRRSFHLKDNGWKEIRIISDEDKLPSDDMIKDFVKIARSFLNAEKWFSVHWNIDEDFVKVNYKHIYKTNEFFTKFTVKEAI